MRQSHGQKKELHVEVGHDAFWAYAWSDDDFLIGAKEGIQRELQERRTFDSLLSMPFARLQVAEFIEDANARNSALKHCLSNLESFSKTWANGWRDNTIIKPEIREGVFNLMVSRDVLIDEATRLLDQLDIDIQQSIIKISAPKIILHEISFDHLETKKFLSKVNDVLNVFSMKGLTHEDFSEAEQNKHDSRVHVDNTVTIYYVIGGRDSLFDIIDFQEHRTANAVHIRVPLYRGALKKSYREIIREFRERNTFTENNVFDVFIVSSDISSLRSAVLVSEAIMPLSKNPHTLMICETSPSKGKPSFLADLNLIYSLESSFFTRILVTGLRASKKSAYDIDAFLNAFAMVNKYFSFYREHSVNGAITPGWAIYGACYQSQSLGSAQLAPILLQQLRNYPFDLDTAKKMHLHVMGGASNQEMVLNDVLMYLRDTIPLAEMVESLRTETPDDAIKRVSLLLLGIDDADEMFVSIPERLKKIFDKEGYKVTDQSINGVSTSLSFNVEGEGNTVLFFVYMQEGRLSQRIISDFIKSSRSSSLPIIIATLSPVSKNFHSNALRRGAYILNDFESKEVIDLVKHRRIYEENTYFGMDPQLLINTIRNEEKANIEKAIELYVSQHSSELLKNNHETKLNPKCLIISIDRAVPEKAPPRLRIYGIASVAIREKEDQGSGAIMRGFRASFQAAVIDGILIIEKLVAD